MSDDFRGAETSEALTIYTVSKKIPDPCDIFKKLFKKSGPILITFGGRENRQ